MKSQKVSTPQDVYIESKENRKKFLAPYREKFEKIKIELKNYDEKGQLTNLDIERAIIESNKNKISPVEIEKRLSEINEKQDRIKIKAKAIKRKQAKIISKLIEIEPSHLSESWIIKQVISWLGDRDCADFIEDIFVRAPKRKVATEKQKNKYMSDYFILKHIDEIINDKGVSIRKACKLLMNRIIHSDKRYHYLWDTEDAKQKLDGEIILERYKYAKKKQSLQSKDYPPYPYFGRDIEDEENGKFTIFGGR
jgi:hypothetical protein